MALFHGVRSACLDLRLSSMRGGEGEGESTDADRLDTSHQIPIVDHVSELQGGRGVK